MKKLGRLIVEDNEGLVSLRCRIRLLAKAINISEVNATKMATMLSEISRIVFDQTQKIDLTISWSDKETQFLIFSYSHKNPSSLPHLKPFEDYFDSIEKKEHEYSLSLWKQIEGTVNMDDLLIEKAHTILHHQSEEQLLEALEQKNEELTQAYERLKKSQNELLNRTQRLTKVGGWELDLNTKELDWTDEVYHIYELAVHQEPNLEAALDYYPEEARHTLMDAIDKSIQTGSSWDLELPMTTAKGNQLWVRALGYPEQKDGKTVRLSGTIQNITDRKSAQIQLERQNEALAFKNKELEQFAYVASHDLQEPLRVISSYVDLFKKRYSNSLDKNGSRFLKHISDASSRMSLLIKDLLDYSRLGSEKEPKTIDCNQAIETVMSNLEVAIRECDAEIQLDQLPVIRGLSRELEQLFQNLISNALKFRKKEGTPRIQIRTKESRDYWHFSISDNGIGVAEDQKERIFVIFQRLHNKEDYPGTGIGLSICKKIVEMHGGNINIESQPDHGSTFHFTLSKSYGKETKLYTIN